MKSLRICGNNSHLPAFCYLVIAWDRLWPVDMFNCTVQEVDLALFSGTGGDPGVMAVSWAGSRLFAMARRMVLINRIHFLNKLVFGRFQ